MWYYVWFVTGIIGGILIGIIIENSSAKNFLKKSAAELSSKNELITAMSKQIRQMRDNRS